MKLLLIGMGPGIGLSVARRFGREGFEVLMVARDDAKLLRYQTELGESGIRSQTFVADAADETAFQDALGEIASRHPDIEVLHYNPSAYNPALPSQLDLPVFVNDLKINIVGGVVAVRAVLPQMRARGRGTIFMTGGGSALAAPLELVSLSIGKAGLRNFTLALAEECRPEGIHVATITIHGAVQAGTHFDPALIADEFWRLYRQPPAEWQTEVHWG